MFKKSALPRLSKTMKFGALYLSPIHPEMEILRRIKKAATNIGAEFYYIDQSGHDLETGKYVVDQLEFVLLFDPSHYALFDTFCYHVQWFCPGLTASAPHLNYTALSYNCQDVLTFPSQRINQANSTAVDDIYYSSRNSKYLYPSVPIDFMHEAQLREDKYTLFYCGINIEGDVNDPKTVRHGELFKILDENGIASFYGPEEISGKKNWSGFKNYRGNIPFDGHSVIREAHSNGVCLAIQHDLHNIQGMITNRLFEGCAAGCVVIADDVDFIRSNFGDSVFYLDRMGKTPEAIATQIAEVVSWANANKEKALQMAQKSQSIFLQKFELSNVIYELCASHEERAQELYELSIAEVKDSTIDVVLHITEGKDIANEVENIMRQDFSSINVIAVVSCKLTQRQQKLLKKIEDRFSLSVFETRMPRFKNENFLLLRTVYNLLEHEYFVLLENHQHWHKSHLREALAAFRKQEGCVATYSGAYLKSKGSPSVPIRMHPIEGLQWQLLSPFKSQYNEWDMNSLIRNLPKSSVVFKKDLLNYCSDSLLDNLYCHEHIALLFASVINEKNIIYTGKLTLFFVGSEFGNSMEELAEQYEVFEGKSYGTLHQCMVDCFYSDPKVQLLLAQSGPPQLPPQIISTTPTGRELFYSIANWMVPKLCFNNKTLLRIVKGIHDMLQKLSRK